MTKDWSIVAVEAATVRVKLPAPVVFGNWIMNDREWLSTQACVDPQGILGL